ncbi:hypothetical protein [Streptomyces sp. CO7]
MSDDTSIGTLPPAESGFLLPHSEPDDADDATVDAHCYATDIAARLSVDPEALGPRTEVKGTGVIALTVCGLERGHPPGALCI